MSEQNSGRGAKAEKANWLHLHKATQENDIKYRGPLSYGGLQILGWLCIVLSVATLMLRFGSTVSDELAPRFSMWIEVFETVVPMSLPFLLLVNFAKILNHEESYKTQILRNAGAMIGIFLGFWLFYDHYILGSISVFATNPAETGQVMDIVIDKIAPNGFFAFNIFVDMFLCTMLMFFLNPECVNHADKSVLNEIREAKYKHCRECLKTGFQQFVTMKTKSSMTRNMRHSDSMPYALEL